jgi:hypothetical protein
MFDMESFPFDASVLAMTAENGNDAHRAAGGAVKVC